MKKGDKTTTPTLKDYRLAANRAHEQLSLAQTCIEDGAMASGARHLREAAGSFEQAAAIKEACLRALTPRLEKP